MMDEGWGIICANLIVTSGWEKLVLQSLSIGEERIYVWSAEWEKGVFKMV